MLAIRRNSSAIHRWTKSGPKQLHVYRDGYPQRVVGSRFIKFNDPALFACRVVPGRTRLIHNFYPGGQQKYSPHHRKSRSGYLSVYCTYFSFFSSPVMHRTLLCFASSWQLPRWRYLMQPGPENELIFLIHGTEGLAAAARDQRKNKFMNFPASHNNPSYTCGARAECTQN
jgi:hypothetical protein